MRFLRNNRKQLNTFVFNEEDFSILDYEQLLKVNGAGGSGSGGSSGGPSSGNSSSYSLSGNLTDRGYPNSAEGYNTNAPALEQDIIIYASDYKGGKDGGPDGYVDHFVNDIGNGQYYDPYTGKTGNISDLNLATEGLGETRKLKYEIHEN